MMTFGNVKKSFKLDVTIKYAKNVLPENVNGDEYIQVDNIVIFKDKPMNGYFFSKSVQMHSVKLFNYVPVLAPRHARDAIEIIKFSTGELKNARFSDKHGVIASAIINLTSLKSLSQVLYNKLINGEPINGSMEATFNAIRVNGVHKGIKYAFQVTKVTNVGHYALLENELGACSIKDKCGVNVIKFNKRSLFNMDKEEIKQMLTEVLAEANASGDTGPPDTSEASGDSDTQAFLDCQAKKIKELEGKIVSLEAGFADYKAKYEQLQASFSKLASKETDKGQVTKKYNLFSGGKQ